VKVWLPQVLKRLNHMKLQTRIVINELESKNLKNSLVAVEHLKTYVDELVKLIPTIQQKILDYSSEMQKYKEEERQKALGTGLGALTEAGLATIDILNGNWEKMTTLAKSGFILDYVRAATGLIEASVSIGAYLSVDGNLHKAKLHIDFYKGVKEELDQYSSTTIEQALKDQSDCIFALAAQFKLHEEDLQKLLDKGAQLQLL